MNEIIRTVKFDYSKNKKPVDIFKEYTSMLTAFEKAETLIMKSISSSLEYKSSLETIETGSIITKIKSWIEDKEPELGNEKLQSDDIQTYISKGLKTIVDNLAQDKNITKNTIEKISLDLDHLAEETKIKETFSFTPIQTKNIIEVSKLMKDATSNLREEETISLEESDGSKLELPKKLNLQVTEKDFENTGKTLVNEATQILKVKKPDYIADSAWELKFGNVFKNIKIEDAEWIAGFLRKDIKVYPGDSIECTIKTVDEYDNFGSLISSKVSITKVWNVIKGEDEND